jgi:hypothetical protein
MEESAMPIASLFEWPGSDGSTSVYDAVSEKMGVRENPPEGCIVHTAGYADDGAWRVFDVWETREHLERFQEDRLFPALQEVGDMPGSGPPSRTEVYDLYSYLTT